MFIILVRNVYVFDTTYLFTCFKLHYKVKRNQCVIKIYEKTYIYHVAIITKYIEYHIQ